MSKPFKILTQDAVNTGKGMINNTFTRFIGPADSLFSLFIRSFGHRMDEKSSIPFRYKDYEFIIYDKNPDHINLAKHILEWDGELDIDNEFKKFRDHLDLGKQKFKVSTLSGEMDYTLGQTSRHDFTDFRASWKLFKNCKFTFINIDIIKNNRDFMIFLAQLPSKKSITNKQYVDLCVNKSEHNHKIYTNSINNILYVLWRKSLKEYSSVVQLNDGNNNYEDYAGKLYAKLNPTFCILPWMHVQYKPSGQSKPCCRYDNNKENRDYDEYRKDPESWDSNLAELFMERANDLIIQQSSVKDTFNSNYWNTARKLTLENKPLSGCYKCYAEEQIDGEVAISMRLGSSILYNDGYLHKKPKFTTPNLEFLEVGFGNYCNLACLSCNSTLSTTWHDDEVKLNQTASKDIQRLIFPKLDNISFDLDDTTLSTLKIIKFTGGEPMINPEFVKFINQICERGNPENISLEIYTNCSYIPSPKLLTNLVKFKNIQLNLSIDAYGAVNDYVRYGSKWEGDQKQTVSKAIDFWLDVGANNKNINVIMSTTLSILNIFNVPELLSWWVEKYKDSGNEITVQRNVAIPTEYDGFFKLQMAFDPSYISLTLLPKEYYQEVLDWANMYIEEFTQNYPDLEFVPESINASIIKLKNAINRSKGNKKNAALLLEYLEKMDTIRGNSANKSIGKVVSKVEEYLLTQDTQI